MSGHAYWRVYVTDNNGAGLISIPELQFRTIAGEYQLPFGGTSVYGTQNGSGNPDNLADAAFDGNAGSKWTSAGNVPDYLGYHFPTAIAPVQVSILGPIAANGPTFAPKNFTIDWSDNGTSWNTVASITNQTAWGSIEERLFNVYATTLSGNIVESLPITNWRVTASDCTTGVIVGTNIINGTTTTGEGGTTYSIICNTPNPCNIICSPKIDYVWSVAKTAISGDYVISTNPESLPHIWKCTTGGITGGTEPTWSLSGTTTDNTVTWTYIAPLTDPISIGPKIPS